MTELVLRAGGRSIADESPWGGIRPYIQLAVPVVFADAKAFALALASRTPTMDPLPILNRSDGLSAPQGPGAAPAAFRA